MQGGLGQALKIALPITSLIFIYFQPGAVQLFFCTQSLLSLSQTFLLQNAFVRSLLGLLPLPPKVVGTSGPTAIGGLRTWQDPNASQAPESQTNARKNASIVDRYVDAAKGRYTDMKETVMGKTEDSQAARKKDNFVSKAERYEMTRRQQAEWERENRNKIKTAHASNGKSGVEMVDELVEEDEDRSRTTASKGKKRQSIGTRR
jgi:YidC/Oxa1 family membrane protein insertase